MWRNLIRKLFSESVRLALSKCSLCCNYLSNICNICFCQLIDLFARGCPSCQLHNVEQDSGTSNSHVFLKLPQSKSWSFSGVPRKCVSVFSAPSNFGLSRVQDLCWVPGKLTIFESYVCRALVFAKSCCVRGFALLLDDKWGYT